jgi:serine/threonine-protein kinase
VTARDPGAAGPARCPRCGAPTRGDARFCGACGAATSGTEPATSPSLGAAPVLIGREIAGRYRVLAKLGEGGMGAVFRAEQISLKRTVAIKLLRPDVSANPMLLRRFNAEAEVVARLSHPSTVNIYDFGQDTDGTLFIAMELIEGRSLRAVIQGEAPLAPGRALAIATQVAASLADAHAHGIVHRDLKPDNVMLADRGRERDVVRVLDFGIAKLRDDARATQAAMTQQGDMLGTPQYMAPEQIRGEPIDGRTDIYALGCLLYEMVTGRLPHDAATVLAMLSKHLIEAPVPPTQRRPDLGLPPAIDALILGAMAKDPRARPPTMDAFGEQIAGLLAGLSPDPRGAPRGALPGAPAIGASSMYAAPTPSPMRVDTPVAPSMYPPQTPPPAASVYPPHAPAPPGHADVAPAHFGRVETPAPPAAYPPRVPGPPGTPGHADVVLPHARHLETPAPHAAYPPHVSAPPGPGSQPPQPWPGAPSHAHRSRRLGLILALGGVLVAGVTVAGVLVARRDRAPAAPDNPTALAAPADGEAPDAERAVDRLERGVRAGYRAGAGTDVAAAPATADPWADPPSQAAAAHPDVPLAAGKKLAVGQGVSIIVPPGFQVRTQDGATVVFDARGVAIAAAPLVDDSDDPHELAQAYAASTGLALESMGTALVAGEPQQMAIFHGSLQGVEVRQFGVPLIGPGYRIGVIFQAPVRLVADPGVQRLLLELWPRRIVVPHPPRPAP